MSTTVILDARKVIRGLTVTTIFLVAANLAGLAAKFRYGDQSWHGLVPLFDLDGERNVPSFFSAGLILFCAMLLGAIASAGRKENRAGWLGLSLIFTFLSADELVSLHERLIDPLRASLHASGLLYFAWLIPYGIVVLVVGLLYLRFLFRLPGEIRSRLVVAGLVYLSGAVGLELIGGAYLESLGDRHNLPYELLTTLEETLEMTGMILLARGLLLHIARYLGGRCGPLVVWLPELRVATVRLQTKGTAYRPSPDRGQEQVMRVTACRSNGFEA